MTDIVKDDIQFPLPGFQVKLDAQRLQAGFDMGKKHHYHDCLEISYFLSGKGVYRMLNQDIAMYPGDIIVLNNSEPHHLEVFEDTVQYVLIFNPAVICSDKTQTIDYEYLKPFLERNIHFFNKVENNSAYSQVLKDNLLCIEEEFQKLEEGYQLMIKARLLLILTILTRHFSSMLRKPDLSRDQQTRIEKALDYLQAHFQEAVGLKSVADEMHMHPQYLSQIFKQVTGTTFIYYLNRLRINHAIELLTKSDKKITHIALECGFNNATSFYSNFKKYTGKMPAEFR